MYRINIKITRKGYGTTEVPTFFVEVGKNGVTDEKSAKRYVLDIIDPLCLFHHEGITTIKIDVI